MQTIREELDVAVAAFVQNVLGVLSRHPLADVMAELEGVTTPRRRVGRPRKTDDLVARIVEFVRRNPESGRSAIARGVGAPSGDVRRALAKAKADGALRIHGERRTARYTATLSHDGAFRLRRRFKRSERPSRVGAWPARRLAPRIGGAAAFSLLRTNAAPALHIAIGRRSNP